jgi:cytochrome c biogenesis protein CcmG/thiol:disulfide interchange protein DsbE
MIRYITPLLAFAILVAVFIKGLDPERDLNELPSPFLGKEAPTFDLPRVHNLEERVTSGDYAGEVALVNFWATWCVGCRQEHEFLMELSRTSDVPIYGIDWRDKHGPALQWLNSLGDPYVATGFDGDATTGIDWGVYGAPETFLIGTDGTVLYKHLGPLNRQVWENDFVPLIEAERGATR